MLDEHVQAAEDAARAEAASARQAAEKLAAEQAAEVWCPRA